MERFSLQWGQWVTQHRGLTIMLAMLVALATAFGGQFLSFTNDYRVFFGSENTHLQAFEELQNTFSKNDNILLVLAPRNGKVFSPDILAAVADVTERAWQTPFSIRVDSISNYQHTTAIGDDLEVANLYEDAEALSSQDIDRLREIA